MLMLILGAAILGIIISVMESRDFPGWGPMILCVIAAVAPAAIINSTLHKDYHLVGTAVGAVCAAFAIAASCDMSLKRSFTAAFLYFCAQSVLTLGFSGMTR